MKSNLLVIPLFICISSFAQNLDLKEGFYEILNEKTEHSRAMLLREDSSQVYFIADQPVVSIHHLKASEVDENTNTLYFIYDENGTKKLLDFTSTHQGGKLGFIYLGSLRKILMVKETVESGIINVGSNEIINIERRSTDPER